MTQPEAPRTQRDVVGDLVARIGHDSFGTGPLAELRRMDPKQAAPGQPALHRLRARYVTEDKLRGDGMNRWALLIHLLALACPNQHRGGDRLGRALFAAGYSEGRLTRLLETPEADFAIVLPRMVRFMVAKGERLDPYELAELVVRGGADRERLNIAQEYYRAEAATRKSQAA
jgi:CRISPR type I-E-associated protein CasB/Cse2